MTEAQRSRAISLILSETPNIHSDMSVTETVLRLGFTFREIGCSPLITAVDERRAQLRANGGVTLTFSDDKPTGEIS